MKYSALLVVLITLIMVLSGCLEDFQGTKEEALEFAKANQGFKLD